MRGPAGVRLAVAMREASGPSVFPTDDDRRPRGGAGGPQVVWRDWPVPSSGRLVAFAVTALVVIAIPGPSVLFVVARALASGRRVAVLSVIGNAIGEYVQVIAVAVGVGALAEQSVTALAVLKLVGGVYLIYLGAKTFTQRRSLGRELAASVTPASDRRTFVQGFAVGSTNPKTVVFLAAILPQLASRSAGDLSGQILVLGIILRRLR